MKNSISCGLIFLLSMNIVFSQSKIETSKKELTKESANNYTESIQFVAQSSNSSSDTNSYLENVFVDVITGIFYYTAWGVLKYGIIGDYKNEKHLLNNLTKYPYYKGIQGDYTSKDSLGISNFRLDLENTFLYNSGTMYGNHFKAKIRPSPLFYIRADARNLFEKNFINHENYNLFIADVALCYDRIRFERFNFGWKMGISYVGNEVHQFGFAYGLNANYFMSSKISFSGNTNWSSINARSVNSYELETKYHKRNGIFTFGYEKLKISTPTYNFVKLGAGVYF